MITRDSTGIGPRRIKVAVDSPCWMPRVGEPVIAVHVEKFDPDELARGLEPAVGRRLRIPDKRRKRRPRFPGPLPRAATAENPATINAIRAIFEG